MIARYFVRIARFGARNQLLSTLLAMKAIYKKKKSSAYLNSKKKKKEKSFCDICMVFERLPYLLTSHYRARLGQVMLIEGLYSSLMVHQQIKLVNDSICRSCICFLICIPISRFSKTHL